MNIRSLLTKIGFEVDHKPLDGVEQRLEGIKHRLDFLTAAAIGTKLFKMGRSFAEIGEKLAVASTSAGISVEAFQKLAYSAQQSAVGQEEMETAMGRLSRQLFEARHGSEMAQKAFRNAGLTGDQVRGFQNSQQALEALSDKFANIQDPIKKAALAQELMGRGSIHMVGFLSKGSAAIRAQGDEAQKLGLILGGRQVESLEELSRSFHKFFGLLTQIGAVIASQIAPVFSFLIDDTLKWFKANRDIIGLNIKNFLQNFAYGLGFVYGLVKILVTELLHLAKAFHLDGHILVLAAQFMGFVGGMLAVIKVARIIATVFGTLRSILTGVAMAMKVVALIASVMEIPIWAVVAAIAALVVAAHDVYELFNGGQTWTGAAFGKIKGMLGMSAEGALAGSATANAGSSNTQSNSITQTTHAPIIQNIYGGTPGEMAKAASAGVDQNMARTRRETLRGLVGPVAQ